MIYKLQLFDFYTFYLSMEMFKNPSLFHFQTSTPKTQKYYFEKTFAHKFNKALFTIAKIWKVLEFQEKN